jgi:excisionase family DNA binding protein
MFTQDQCQKLYEGIHIIAKVFAEAYIEERNKLEKYLPPGVDTTNVKTQLQHNEKLVLSVPETAKLLGLSRNATYEFVREGKIPCVRYGKRVLVPRVKLLEMINKQS